MIIGYFSRRSIIIVVPHGSGTLCFMSIFFVLVLLQFYMIVIEDVVRSRMQPVLLLLASWRPVLKKEKRKKQAGDPLPVRCFFFFNRANPILITENGNTTASEVLQEAGKKGKASSNYAPCQVNVMLELLHVFNVCINRHIDVSGTSR